MAIQKSNTSRSIIVLRGNKNMSQEDLARKACITLDELKEIESGKRPSPDSFELIAEALGLTPADFSSCINNPDQFFKNHDIPVAA
ncbi:MAG: helix-turn-helix transcriptional regulator [Candidatus Paceibacterota bacterium]